MPEAERRDLMDMEGVGEEEQAGPASPVTLAELARIVEAIVLRLRSLFASAHLPSGFPPMWILLRF